MRLPFVAGTFGGWRRDATGTAFPAEVRKA
jgi:hypothetical protein